MKTITGETIQESPTVSATTTSDMVGWWTRGYRGTFNWDHYRQIIDAKRYLQEESNFKKNV